MRVTKEPEVRKQEIVDTAFRLFGEKGYEKTSITDIAKAIGVAQGLCYRYFPSKEALFDSAIEQYADVLVEQMVSFNVEKNLTLRQMIKAMPSAMEVLILTSVAMGATNGIYILLSQAIGAKNREKAESLIFTSFCMAVAFSILVTALLEAFLPEILKALNTPTETYDMAYNYLSIYVLGYLYLYFTAILRSFGNSMFQAVAMLVSTILNAVLDPVFIHFIGFHGAALASLLSQAICLLFILIYLKKKELFVFKFSAFDRKEILPLIQKAVPSVLQQCIPAISTT